MSTQTAIEPRGVLSSVHSDDLRQRSEQTRWPDDPGPADWEHGADTGYLKELVRYWKDEFDWGG